jgi:hypothetical protein
MARRIVMDHAGDRQYDFDNAPQALARADKNPRSVGVLLPR